MRKLVMILLVTMTMGATLSAAAQIAFSDRVRQSSTIAPIVYNDAYGHWQKCADVTGMCGLGVA